MNDRSRPFTVAMARDHGLNQASLRRAVARGQVRRLLRGVYVDADVSLTPIVRAEAVALVSEGRVAINACAAWVHGLWWHETGPLDFGPCLAPVEIAGQSVQRMLSCVVHLVSRLAPHEALGVVDAALRAGLSHAELIAVAPTGVVASGDDRAVGHDESLLRWVWCEAGLPSPRVGELVDGVRIPVGLPDRGFGLVLPGSRRELPGWTLVEMTPGRVREAPDLAVDHVRRAWPAHLLAQLESA